MLIRCTQALLRASCDDSRSCATTNTKICRWRIPLLKPLMRRSTLRSIIVVTARHRSMASTSFHQLLHWIPLRLLLLLPSLLLELLVRRMRSGKRCGSKRAPMATTSSSAKLSGTRIRSPLALRMRWQVVRLLECQAVTRLLVRLHLLQRPLRKKRRKRERLVVLTRTAALKNSRHLTRTWSLNNK